MKKVFCLFLALALMLAAAACSGEEEKTTSAAETATTAETAAAQTTTAAKSAELPAYEAKLNAEGFDVGAVIAPTVLYDNQELATVTATGLEYEDYAVLVHLEIVNHTQAGLSFDMDHISANHLMGGYAFFDIIPAQETAVEDVTIPYSDMVNHGVTVLSQITIGEISLTDENWEETLLGPFTLQTNAFGIAEETGTAYEAMISADNQKLFSYSVLAAQQERTDLGQGVYATAVLLTESDEDGPTLAIELHNDSDAYVSVSLRNPVVNGIALAMSGYYSITIAPHCYAVHDVGLGGYGVPDYCFETLGLLPVSTVDFDYALDGEGMEAEALIPASIRVSGVEKGEMPQGLLAYDKDGLTIRSFGLVCDVWEDGYIGDVAVAMIVENKTGKELEIQDDGAGDLMVNGEEVQFSSEYYTIGDGTVAAICYSTYDLGGESMPEITDGHMTIHVYESGVFSDWEAIEVPLVP